MRMLVFLFVSCLVMGKDARATTCVEPVNREYPYVFLRFPCPSVQDLQSRYKTCFKNFLIIESSRFNFFHEAVLARWGLD
ncbi:unnamed protein product [Nesidiocoris tenuis]|uniref:Secreted protein n=1 Tax=Nesidiocoris tenuis TaxID=355587 RepID=A0A6H5G8Q6_9HEMI|nr:unnamed protein product [Nesidiocoris tenuis]